MHTRTHNTTHSVVEFTENYRALRSGMLQRVCVQNTHREAILNCGTDDIGCDKGKKKRKEVGWERKRQEHQALLSLRIPQNTLFSHIKQTHFFFFFSDNVLETIS